MISDFISSKIFLLLVMGILIIFILLYAKASRTCIKYADTNQRRSNILKLINKYDESDDGIKTIDKINNDSGPADTKSIDTKSDIETDTKSDIEPAETELEPIAFDVPVQFSWSYFSPSAN